MIAALNDALGFVGGVLVLAGVTLLVILLWARAWQAERTDELLKRRRSR